jgi:hypothetical protein
MPAFNWMDGLTDLASLRQISAYRPKHLHGSNGLPRDIRDQSKQERHNGSPIPAVVVSIPSMSTIQAGHINMSLLDEPVVGCEQCRNGREESGQTSHEVQERASGVDDLPRNHDPAGSNGHDDDASSDVDVLWEQIRQVIGSADDVGRQVGTDLVP